MTGGPAWASTSDSIRRPQDSGIIDARIMRECLKESEAPESRGAMHDCKKKERLGAMVLHGLFIDDCTNY